MTTTVLPEGHIALPRVVRDRLSLGVGAEVSIEIHGNSVVLKRVERSLPDWRTMEGMARGAGRLTDALMEERASERAHDDARLEGP